MDNLLVNAKEAGRLLSIGERKLWELTNINAIPSRKIGRSRKYSIEELRAWVRAGNPCEPGAAARVLKGVEHV